MRVRCLGCEIDGESSRRAIEVGDTAAGFQRSRMAALENRVYIGFYGRGLKRLIGRCLVSYFPMKDVIALLFAIFAENRRVWVSRFVRIYQHRQLFIFDFDQLGGVGGSVTVFRDDECNFLRLEQDLPG